MLKAGWKRYLRCREFRTPEVAAPALLVLGADAQIESVDCLSIKSPLTGVAEEWTAAAVLLCGGILSNAIDRHIPPSQEQDMAL